MFNESLWDTGKPPEKKTKKKKQNEHNDPPVCGGDKSTLQTVERWEWWLTGKHGAHCPAVE